MEIGIHKIGKKSRASLVYLSDLSIDKETVINWVLIEDSKIKVTYNLISPKINAVNKVLNEVLNNQISSNLNSNTINKIDVSNKEINFNNLLSVFNKLSTSKDDNKNKERTLNSSKNINNFSNNKSIESKNIECIENINKYCFRRSINKSKDSNYNNTNSFNFNNTINVNKLNLLNKEKDFDIYTNTNNTQYNNCTKDNTLSEKPSVANLINIFNKKNKDPNSNTILNNNNNLRTCTNKKITITTDNKSINTIINNVQSKIINITKKIDDNIEETNGKKNDKNFKDTKNSTTLISNSINYKNSLFINDVESKKSLDTIHLKKIENSSDNQMSLNKRNSVSNLNLNKTFLENVVKLKSNLKNLNDNYFSLIDAFFIAGLSKDQSQYIPDSEDWESTCKHDLCSSLPATQADILFKYPLADKDLKEKNLEINTFTASMFYPRGLKICYCEDEQNIEEPSNPDSSITNQDGQRYFMQSYQAYLKLEKKELDSNYKLDLRDEFIQIERLASIFCNTKNSDLQKMFEKKLENRLEIMTEINFRDYVYIPICFVLISKEPFINELKIILDSIINLIICSSNSINNSLIVVNNSTINRKNSLHNFLANKSTNNTNIEKDITDLLVHLSKEIPIKPKNLLQYEIDKNYQSYKISTNLNSNSLNQEKHNTSLDIKNIFEKKINKSVNFNTFNNDNTLKCIKQDIKKKSILLNFFLPYIKIPINICYSSLYDIPIVANNILSVCLLEKFTYKQLSTIFYMIKTEQKLLFHSESIELIPKVINSFLNILYPLEWTSTLIPILPFEMIKFTQSFMPFIMGIEDSLLSNVKEYLDENNIIYFISIDNGVIYDSNYYIKEISNTVSLPPKKDSAFLNFSSCKLNGNKSVTKNKKNNSQNIKNYHKNSNNSLNKSIMEYMLNDNIKYDLYPIKIKRKLEEKIIEMEDEYKILIETLVNKNTKIAKSTNVTRRGSINSTSKFCTKTEINKTLNINKEELIKKAEVFSSKINSKVYNIDNQIYKKDNSKKRFSIRNANTNNKLFFLSNFTNDYIIYNISDNIDEINYLLDVKEKALSIEKKFRQIFLYSNEAEFDNFEKYLSFIDEIPLFNSESFIKSKIHEDKAFYEEFVSTQIFQSFLQSKQTKETVFNYKLKNNLSTRNRIYDDLHINNEFSNNNNSNYCIDYFNKDPIHSDREINYNKINLMTINNNFNYESENVDYCSIKEINIDLKKIIAINKYYNINYFEAFFVPPYYLLDNISIRLNFDLYCYSIFNNLKQYYENNDNSHGILLNNNNARKSSLEEKLGAIQSNIQSSIINRYFNKSCNSLYIWDKIYIPESSSVENILVNKKNFNRYYFPFVNIDTDKIFKSALSKLGALSNIKRKLSIINMKGNILNKINKNKEELLSKSISLSNNNTFESSTKEIINDYMCKILTSIKLDCNEKSDFHNILQGEEGKYIFPRMIYLSKFKDGLIQCLDNYSFKDMSVLISMYLTNCGLSKDYYDGIRLVVKTLFLYYKVNSKHKTLFLFNELTKSKYNSFVVLNSLNFWIFYFENDLKEHIVKKQENIASILLQMIPKLIDLKVDIKLMYKIIIDNLAKPYLTNVRLLKFLIL